jgi:hypothetical protein
MYRYCSNKHCLGVERVGARRADALLERVGCTHMLLERIEAYRYCSNKHCLGVVIGTAVINTHIQWVASESYQGNTCCR